MITYADIFQNPQNYEKWQQLAAFANYYMTIRYGEDLNKIGKTNIQTKLPFIDGIFNNGKVVIQCKYVENGSKYYNTIAKIKEKYPNVKIVYFVNQYQNNIEEEQITYDELLIFLNKPFKQTIKYPELQQYLHDIVNIKVMTIHGNFYRISQFLIDFFNWKVLIVKNGDGIDFETFQLEFDDLQKKYDKLFMVDFQLKDINEDFKKKIKKFQKVIYFTNILIKGIPRITIEEYESSEEEPPKNTVPYANQLLRYKQVRIHSEDDYETLCEFYNYKVYIVKDDIFKDDKESEVDYNAIFIIKPSQQFLNNKDIRHKINKFKKAVFFTDLFIENVHTITTEQGQQTTQQTPGPVPNITTTQAQTQTQAPQIQKTTHDKDVQVTPNFDLLNLLAF